MKNGINAEKTVKWKEKLTMKSDWELKLFQ